MQQQTALTTIRRRAVRCTTAVLALSSFLLLPAEAQQQTSVEQLAVAIRALQAELLGVRLEFQANKVARIQAELEAAADNRKRLEKRERTVHQEVTTVERQLSAAPITSDSRAELEGQRGETLETAAKARWQRLEAEQKESVIAKALHEANRELAALLNRSKQRK